MNFLIVSEIFEILSKTYLVFKRNEIQIQFVSIALNAFLDTMIAKQSKAPQNQQQHVKSSAIAIGTFCRVFKQIFHNSRIINF